MTTGNYVLIRFCFLISSKTFAKETTHSVCFEMERTNAICLVKEKISSFLVREKIGVYFVREKTDVVRLCLEKERDALRLCFDFIVFG